jgi:hypothetical protein
MTTPSPNFLYTALLVLLALLTAMPCFAGDDTDISINKAKLSLQNDTYLLNAQIDYTLSDDAIEALQNGVTLIFNVDLSIIETRKWIWNKHLYTITLPYQIKFHTLAGTYQTSDTTNNLHHNFSTLTAALSALGSISESPIHSLPKLIDVKAHGALKTYLNIETLPLPMRPLAYITPGWHIRSNDYKWSLEQ